MFSFANQTKISTHQTFFHKTNHAYPQWCTSSAPACPSPVFSLVDAQTSTLFSLDCSTTASLSRTYETCRSTVTPRTSALRVTRATVDIVSTSVAVRPPCRVPILFWCSGSTTSSARQYPSPPLTIWTCIKYRNVCIRHEMMHDTYLPNVAIQWLPPSPPPLSIWHIIGLNLRLHTGYPLILLEFLSPIRQMPDWTVTFSFHILIPLSLYIAWSTDSFITKTKIK
jgi:hypothetical protein